MSEALQGMPTAGMSPQVLLLVLFVQMVVVGLLIGLPLGFGEEYGWRSFLQSHLVKMGKQHGILILGLIWSVWHYPAILMGHNYPGQPVLGVLMMTIYTTLSAFILGYVMLKTGSIWLVAFLHAINNQTYSYLTTLVYQPQNAILSFGGGIYGALLLAVIVILLLRNPVWNDEDGAQSIQTHIRSVEEVA